LIVVYYCIHMAIGQTFISLLYLFVCGGDCVEIFFFIFKTRLIPSTRTRDNIVADTRYIVCMAKSYTDSGGRQPRRIYLHRYSYVLCILLFFIIIIIFFFTITVSLSKWSGRRRRDSENIFLYVFILCTYVDMLTYHNIRMRVNVFRNVNDQPELKHITTLFSDDVNSK